MKRARRALDGLEDDIRDQTVRRDNDGKMTAAAMGRPEDRLVKRNSKWLIQWRKLTVFTD